MYTVIKRMEVSAAHSLKLSYRSKCENLHLYLEASGYLVAYPTGYVLGCGIEGQHFIKIMMIQLFLYHLLDVTEVYHHSVRIQLFGTAIDSDNPVVTVQILTLTAIRKFQSVRLPILFVCTNKLGK